MAGFTEQALQKKLTDLNNTLPSIQTLSLWLLHHRKHSSIIVKVWYGELKKERQARRLLNLVHLSNDVIQNSRKKWPLFQQQFQDYMEKAFAHVARHSDEQILPSLRRVIDVWRQRAVFSDEYLTQITYAVTSNLSRDLLLVFNENGANTPPQKVSAKTKTKTKSVDPNAAASPEIADDVSAANVKRTFSLPSPTTSKTLLELRSPEDIISEAPTTETFVKALKDLENPASADVEIRERIAQFPPDVADVSKLRQISSHLQAERFSSLVNEADELLTVYNARLEQEMAARKSTNELLDKYLRAQKCLAEKNAVELAEWKSKLLQLTTEKNDLMQHVDSLPDLSKLPDFINLPPLPSAGDLFMK